MLNISGFDFKIKIQIPLINYKQKWKNLSERKLMTLSNFTDLRV